MHLVREWHFLCRKENTISVFARNLLRGIRRKNIFFFHISFRCMNWDTNLDFTSLHYLWFEDWANSSITWIAEFNFKWMQHFFLSFSSHFYYSFVIWFSLQYLLQIIIKKKCKYLNLTLSIKWKHKLNKYFFCKWKFKY